MESFYEVGTKHQVSCLLIHSHTNEPIIASPQCIFPLFALLLHQILSAFSIQTNEEMGIRKHLTQLSYYCKNHNGALLNVSRMSNKQKCQQKVNVMFERTLK